MLKTNRLSFRHFVPADVDQLYQEIYSNPKVAGALSSTGSLSLEQTAFILHRRIKHWQDYGFGTWALIYKQNQHLIGHCGLHYLNNTPEVELTYTINPAYWQQGLATEASRAVLHWGFETLKFEQIAAVTGPNNLASQRVMQKLGMTYRKNIQYSGTEVLYYALSRDDFRAQSQPDARLLSSDGSGDLSRNSPS